MEAARAHGTVVSYDLNYRPSLWHGLGGPARAAEVNRSLVGLADVLIGNEEDYSAALGYEIGGADENLLDLDLAAYAQLLEQVVADYPRLAVAAATLRQARTATRNGWSAVCQTRAGFYEGPRLDDLEILDRVGGGDSLASGLVYGFLTGLDADAALAYGVAHGALAMTTPGDTSTATLAEVERLVRGGSARVTR
jgi:2-dehydro-3-deoxygluconokinase